MDGLSRNLLSVGLLAFVALLSIVDCGSRTHGLCCKFSAVIAEFNPVHTL